MATHTDTASHQLQSMTNTSASQPLDSLLPDPRNARRHTDRNLATITNALREVGAARSVVVDEHGIILAGNATVTAASAAGIDRVRIVDADGSQLIAVRRSGLSDAQKRRLALFDNRAAELAEWDPAVLATLDDTDLAGLWDDEELAALLALDESAAPASLLTDPDGVPEVPAQPVTRPGDHWVLGRHRLVCGDATSPTALNALMSGQLADLVVTDPHYGVSYTGGTPDELTIANDNLDDAAFLPFLTNAFTAMARVSRPGPGIYVWHADSRGLLIRQAFLAAGWKLAQCLVWIKQSRVLGRQDYHWRHEPILYGWQPGAGHYFVDDRTQTTVWEVDRPARSPEHPTMKPVALIALAVGSSSRPGDVVLDPFGGAGSTLLACEQLGRTARLLELDPRYCDVIVRRWEAATGNTARHEPVDLHAGDDSAGPEAGSAQTDPARRAG